MQADRLASPVRCSSATNAVIQVTVAHLKPLQDASSTVKGQSFTELLYIS